MAMLAQRNKELDVSAHMAQVLLSLGYHCVGEHDESDLFLVSG
jgi:hypothetical protein